MVSEYKSTEHLGPDEWHVVFDLLKDNQKAKRKDALKELSGWDGTTVGRALAVGKLIMSRGLKPLDKEEAEQIAETARYDTKAKFIQSAHYAYLNWHNDYSTKEYLRKSHLDNLKKQLEVLRSCLTSPQLELGADFRDYPLELFGEGWSQDWRLEPVTWFRLCTPDLTDEAKWGLEYQQLKQHMKDSSFEKHYLQLYQEVINLDKAYKEAATNFQRDYKKTWEDMQVKMVSPYDISRIPAFSEPDWEEYESCCDRTLGDMMVDKFAESIDGLYQWQGKLENMLDQLNKDLLPSIVDSVIANGKCNGCPK